MKSLSKRNLLSKNKLKKFNKRFMLNNLLQKSNNSSKSKFMKLLHLRKDKRNLLNKKHLKLKKNPNKKLLNKLSKTKNNPLLKNPRLKSL
jgi:hypothetical protein